MRHKYIPLYLVFCILAVMGCAELLPEGLEKLYPVELTFTQENTPLDNALVSLVSVDNSLTYTVGGTTHEDGKVLLYTHGKYAGAPAGKYKVRVVKTGNTELPDHPTSIVDPEYEAWQKKLATMKTESWSWIEKKYTAIDTTPLEIEITGKMSKSFDVGKPGRYNIVSNN